jgi:hypothetical protein
VEISPNQLHFFMSYAVALLACGLIGKWYVWPAIARRDPTIVWLFNIEGILYLTYANVSTFKDHGATQQHFSFDSKIPVTPTQ